MPIPHAFRKRKRHWLKRNREHPELLKRVKDRHPLTPNRIGILCHGRPVTLTTIATLFYIGGQYGCE